MRLVLLICFLFSISNATMIKEVANVIGVRDNQLIGYGLVVGLRGTGDGSSSKFTLQSLSNMLQTVNVKIDPKDIKSKNIAAVMITAQLPSFARQGDKLDLLVSSIGDAKSLEGGTLLLTPLKGVDGDIYALAQGPVTIGGKNSSGASNHSTAGTIFSGALVEREVVYDIYNKESIKLSLHNSNFQMAMELQNKINKAFSNEVAKAIDPRTIQLKKPVDSSMVEFLAKILELPINLIREQKIIIDERTGTVISGTNIQIEPVVITHGEITVKIEPSEIIAADNSGETDLKSGVSLSPEGNLINMKPDKITVANVTRALNRLGASPEDIIAILQNLKRAGAINAKLEVI